MTSLACGALMRILFCLQTISIVYFSVLHPRSVVDDLARTIGPDVWYVLAGMCLISAAALADTFINDILPERYSLNWGLNFRHVLFMSLAIGYALMLRFTVLAGMMPAIPYLLINIVFIVVAAFIDVRHRFCTPDKGGHSHA